MRGAVLLQRIALLALLPLLGLTAAGANTDSGELAQCRQIPGDAARLACYDGLAAGSSPKAAVTTPAPATAPTTVAQPAAVTVAPSTQPAFGAASLPRSATGDNEPKTLESRLIGNIGELKKGQRYKLENGQVWQNIDDHPQFTDLQNPEVRIERNFLGSYWMTLGEKGLQVRVRRVQ